MDTQVLEVGVHEQIRQLVISPNNEYLAILTAHTVHVVILPDSSHLGKDDTRAIRLRPHTIGSTTHVLSQSPVINALWHPLGVGGNCLVTITAEAVVRLWELDRSNRLSYDKPSLAFDMKKLAYGKFTEDDFSAPNDLRKARGFSVDALDIDVASASFGGTGVDSESGWSAMTLWVAMKGGDVYALCPLLPSKWAPTNTLLPSLMSAVAAKSELLPGESTEDEKMYCDQQYRWLKDVDGQDPLVESGRDVYARPLLPGAVPKLQGPFYILPDEVGEELPITGIHVIPSKLDSNQLMTGEEEQVEDFPGLSCSVVCLSTQDCRVYITLGLEGVEAKWLPSKKVISLLPCYVIQLIIGLIKKQLNPHRSTSPTFQPELVLLEVLETRKAQSTQQDWPSFSPDSNSPYSFLLTHSQGVFFFSCDTWLSTLEDELQDAETEGAAVRLESLGKLPGTLRERIFDFSSRLGNTNMVNTSNVVPASIVLNDADLGYFLLTSVNGLPQAALLDSPDQLDLEQDIKREDGQEYFHIPDLKHLAPAPSRAPFQASEVFWSSSGLATFLETNKHPRQMNTVKDVIRLSPNTLDLMTKAHRILSHETHQLGIATSDMFVRIESLQVQLQDQIRKAREVRDLVQDLGTDKGSGSRDHNGLFRRIGDAQEKQKDLHHRCEALKRRANNVGARDMNEKERGFAKEVDKMAKSILEDRNPEENGAEDDEQEETNEGEMKSRFTEVRAQCLLRSSSARH